MMVTSIGSVGLGRTIDQLRVETPKAGAAGPAPAANAPAGPTNPAAAMAAEGAPVDGAKVAAIKAGLANGSYRIDPQAIAERMIALDLPKA